VALIEFPLFKRLDRRHAASGRPKAPRRQLSGRS
jgi:hypothetical protein